MELIDTSHHCHYCQYASFLCDMLPLYLFIVYETLSSFINTLPPLFLSSLTEPSDLLTSYNISFITKGPSDPGRRLPLTTSAGWLGRCPGVQCSSTHSIDKTTLHILALSSKLSPTQSVLLVSPKMFPKKYLPEDRLRQKICQSSPELRALAAKLEQVITIFQDDVLRNSVEIVEVLISGLHQQRESCTNR